MASYAFSEELQASYSWLAYQYKDSILRVKRPDSQGYQLTLGDKLLYEGKYDEAIGVLEGCYDIHSQKRRTSALPFLLLHWQAFMVPKETTSRKRNILPSRQ